MCVIGRLVPGIGQTKLVANLTQISLPRGRCLLAFCLAIRSIRAANCELGWSEPPAKFAKIRSIN